MKKFLLSAMAFMLLATGANAQNFNKTDKEAAPATFSSLSSVAAHQNGPKKLLTTRSSLDGQAAQAMQVSAPQDSLHGYLPMAYSQTTAETTAS